MDIEEARTHCKQEIESVEAILQSARILTFSEMARLGIEYTVAALGLVWLDRLEAGDRAAMTANIRVSPGYPPTVSADNPQNWQAEPGEQTG